MKVELIQFCILFLLVLIIYLIYTFFRRRRYIPRRVPLEVQYLVKKYHLDIEKISYFRLMIVIAFVNSFDLTVVVMVSSLFSNTYLQFFVGFLMIFIVILISYHIIGTIYKKKGLVKDV